MAGHCKSHTPHAHGPSCGHLAVRHDGHVDYLHDGHLHHSHQVDGKAAHYDEHVIAVSDENSAGCTEQVEACCEAGHWHGPDCGHPAVPHGDHCDDHGLIEVV